MNLILPEIQPHIPPELLELYEMYQGEAHYTNGDGRLDLHNMLRVSVKWDMSFWDARYTNLCPYLILTRHLFINSLTQSCHWEIPMKGCHPSIPGESPDQHLLSTDSILVMMDAVPQKAFCWNVFQQKWLAELWNLRKQWNVVCIASRWHVTLSIMKT